MIGQKLAKVKKIVENSENFKICDFSLLAQGQSLQVTGTIQIPLDTVTMRVCYRQLISINM